MSSGTLIIDNAGPQIRYSPGWHADGSNNEYKRTTSNTETRGAFFMFTFVGTSVAVYGTLDVVTLPNTTYVVDGGTPFPFFGQPQLQVQYQQIFYASPPLPYGEHTLIGSCADEGAHVILDYLVVEIPLESPTNSSSLTPPLATPTIHNSKPTPPTAAIVGGVLGGLLLILTILTLYLYYHHHFRGSSRASFMSTRTEIQQTRTVSDDGTFSINQHSEGHDHDGAGASIHRDVLVDVAVHKPSLPPHHQARLYHSHNM